MTALGRFDCGEFAAQGDGGFVDCWIRGPVNGRCREVTMTMTHCLYLRLYLWKRTKDKTKKNQKRNKNLWWMPDCNFIKTNNKFACLLVSVCENNNIKGDVINRSSYLDLIVS